MGSHLRDIEQRLPFLEQYGSHTLAYSTLQQDIEAYFVGDKGYVGYTMVDTILPYLTFGLKKPKAFVLSEPIAASEAKGEVLDSFLKEFPDAMFFQVYQDTAELLSKRGYYANEFGTETDIDMQTFKPKGKKFEWVRRHYNYAKRGGITQKEVNIETVDKSRLEEISNEWISSKASKKGELSFLARPAIFEAEPGVRKFLQYLNDELVGFAFFSPMYKDGKKIGYYYDIHRHISEVHDREKKSEKEYTQIQGLRAKDIVGVPRGLSYFTALEAMKVLREEDPGIETMAFGLSPFHGIEDNLGIHSEPTKALFRWIYNGKFDEEGSLAHLAANHVELKKGLTGLALRAVNLHDLEKVKRLLSKTYDLVFSKYNNPGNYNFKHKWRGKERDIYICSKERLPLRQIINLYRVCKVL